MRSALSGPTSIVISRIASAMLGVVSAPILARALGPDGRGQTAAALALTGLLPIALSLGMPIVARRRGASGEEVAPTVRAIRLLSLGVGALGGLIAYFSTLSILESLSYPAKVALVVSGIGCSVSGLLWISDVNILIARERHGAFALVNLTSGAVFVALVIVFALMGQISVSVVIWLNLAAMAATLVVSSCLLRVGIRGPRARTRALLVESRRFYGAQLAEASSYRLDQFFALPIIGAHAAGLYSVAATISLLPMAVGQAVGSSTFRRFVRANSEGTFRADFSTDLRGAVVAGWAASISVAVATPAIVVLGFGRDFSDAIIPALIALVGSVAVVGNYVVNSGLVALNKGWQQTSAQFVGLLTGLVLLVLLGPILGPSGAAMASTLGYWLTFWCGYLATGLGIRDLSPRVGDLRAARDLFRQGRTGA